MNHSSQGERGAVGRLKMSVTLELCNSRKCSTIGQIYQETFKSERNIRQKESRLCQETFVRKKA
jgi:hypothetical protein